MIILWNKQKGTGGAGGGGGNGGGGGSSSFPTIVTDSGSSLPSASSYQIGDTFLNTSTKKIYTPVVNGYIANSNPTPNLTATIDYNTGIATGFGSSDYASRQISPYWIGDDTKNFYVKFKLKDTGVIPIVTFYGGSYSPSGQDATFFVDGGKIYHIVASIYNVSVSSVTLDKTQILDTILDIDTIYILKIQKTGTNCVAQLTLEDETVIEEKTFTTVSLSDWSYFGTMFGIGPTSSSSYSYAETKLDVYLAESTAQLLIPNTSTLSWDNGTNLVNNTEYADKTNEILYIYENNELLAINKPNSFAQITGNATDNTSLATALNGKQAKASSSTYSSASVSLSISANYHYTFSNSAITSITFSGCEKSFDETTIEFQTGATPPTVTDNSGITWMDNFDITNLSANKSYLIVIFNKLGFVKEY